MANYSTIRKAKTHNEAKTVFSIKEEKIFASDKTNKRLISNMYKHLNIKKTNIWIKKMGKRTRQTFFQMGNAYGRQAHEEILNITSCQGNTNQNRNEISPHICQNGYHQERTQIANIGKDAEKREALYTADGNVNCCS